MDNLYEIQSDWDNCNDDFNEAFSLLPDGKYLAIITESELKQNKNNNGKHLLLEFQIEENEGENRERFKGRKLWVRLNIINDNKDAKRIAITELKAIVKATTLSDQMPQSTSELHVKALCIVVKQQKRRDDETKMENKIEKYYPASKFAEEF